MKIVLIILLCSSLLSADDISTVNLESIQWIPRDTSNNVISYKQKKPDTKLVAVRGKTVINASLPMVLTILTSGSFEQQKRWVPNLIEFKTLSQSTLLKRSIYVHVDLTFPVRDRDFAYNANIYRDHDQVVVKYFSAATLFPEKRGVIRGNMKTVFLLTALDSNRTVIDLRAIADPGGIVPPFFVNLAQRDYSETMLCRIREEVEDSSLERHVHEDFKLFTFNKEK